MAAFVDAAHQAAQTASQQDIMTTTWNGAVSHSQTGSARVDLFYSALRGTDDNRLQELLAASYAEDALHTLKIIAYLRDCRGGKGERDLGRGALKWLARHHPDQLKHNMKYYVGTFGRFDDTVAMIDTPVERDMLEYLKNQLDEDLKALAANRSVSLCAKWVASEKKSLDTRFNMNKRLCRHMNIRPAALRKVYLAPLRARLRIVERFMCAKEWDKIELDHVPSMAMNIYGKPNHAFERHLEAKFAAWKSKLTSGETKVNAKVLFPHQVVEQYMHGRREVDELLEAQWRVLVEEGSQLGCLKKTLVMSDVSGSMMGLPMNVSIALGLMISELSQDKFKNLVLTFESNPRFHHVKGESLYERVKDLQRAPWGGSTDFVAAFREILRVAKEANVPADEMPDRLIVVSDMQFNMADRNHDTNHQVLKRDFEAAGYKVPHLVFWNVNGSVKDVPTKNNEANVSLVSGFSTAVLKAVLTGEEITPLQTLLNVVLDERYDVITLSQSESDEENAVLL